MWQIYWLGANRVGDWFNRRNSSFNGENWFIKYGAEKFVLALDANINASGSEKSLRLAVGRKKVGTIRNVDRRFPNRHLQQVLCTDISRDGTLTGSNIDFIKKFVRNIHLFSFTF